MPRHMREREAEMARIRKCAGGFPDLCSTPPGPRNSYWCNDCDQKRMDGISASLKKIAASFEDDMPDDREAFYNERAEERP